MTYTLTNLGTVQHDDADAIMYMIERLNARIKQMEKERDALGTEAGAFFTSYYHLEISTMMSQIVQLSRVLSAHTRTMH